MGRPGRHRRHPHAHGAHGRYRNPSDLSAYLRRIEDPARAEWQKPDRVLSALALGRGHTACEVGAGPGYFALRMARIVGPRGHVYAVDAEPRILGVLRERIRAAGVLNVTPVLALESDPLVPDRSCHRILIINTYHHLPDGVTYLRRLRTKLRRGGRIVNIDFHRTETPMGPPLRHRVAREAFLKDARRAGLRLAREHTFLPHQYYLVLAPR